MFVCTSLFVFFSPVFCFCHLLVCLFFHLLVCLFSNLLVFFTSVFPPPCLFVFSPVSFFSSPPCFLFVPHLLVFFTCFFCFLTCLFVFVTCLFVCFLACLFGVCLFSHLLVLPFWFPEGGATADSTPHCKQNIWWVHYYFTTLYSPHCTNHTANKLFGESTIIKHRCFQMVWDLEI